MLCLKYYPSRQSKIEKTSAKELQCSYATRAVILPEMLHVEPEKMMSRFTY